MKLTCAQLCVHGLDGLQAVVSRLKTAAELTRSNEHVDIPDPVSMALLAAHRKGVRC